MRNAVGYTIGEPEIGEMQCVFRNETAFKDFIFGLPERNLVDLYKATGIVEEGKDDGSPDGLVMLVLQYEPFKFIEN